MDAVHEVNSHTFKHTTCSLDCVVHTQELQGQNINKTSQISTLQGSFHLSSHASGFCTQTWGLKLNNLISILSFQWSHTRFTFELWTRRNELVTSLSPQSPPLLSVLCHYKHAFCSQLTRFWPIITRAISPVNRVCVLHEKRARDSRASQDLSYL